MRVLHVLNTGSYSGAENVVITLIKSLENRVEFAYTSPDGPINQILSENRIKFYPIKQNKMNSKDLKKVIKDYKPDIIHTHDFNAGVVAFLAGTKKPIINHIHQNPPWLHKICVQSLAYLISSIKFKKILTVSDAIMNEYVFNDTVINKCLNIGNPININTIKSKTLESGILRNQSDIMFLGRISNPKNPELFIEIVNEIIKTKPDVRVAMVGNGELFDTINNKISELGINKSVKLYGFQNNPYGLLNSTKIVCMPSKWEGFGLAAIEAITLGKPVICSGAGGLKHIITEECGSICDNLDDYKKEIIKLLDNDEYYQMKSKGAQKYAENFNNIDQYTSKILEIYTDIVK